MLNFESFDLRLHKDLTTTKWFCLSYTINNAFFTVYYYETPSIIGYLTLKFKSNTVFYVDDLDNKGYFIVNDAVRFGYKFDWLCLDYNIFYVRVILDNIYFEFRCLNKLVPLTLDTAVPMFLNKKLPFFPVNIFSPIYIEGKFLKLEHHHFSSSIDYDNYGLEGGFYVVNTKDIISSYCGDCVYYLKQIVILLREFFKVNLMLDPLKHRSISGISLYYFKTNYGGLDMDISLNIDSYIRQAFYGGRCEVFGNPNKFETSLHFDFRGMYGLCMLELIPSGGYRIEYLDKILKPGFYKISFRSEMEYPILPVRDGRLSFYNGSFVGIYWFEEILLFQEYGGEVLHIHFAIISDRYDFSMEKFSNKMSSLRGQGALGNFFGKILTNSLYGRLGSSKKLEKTVISLNKPGVEGKLNYASFGDFFVFKESFHQKNNNVMVAAAITSKARIRLYRAMMVVLSLGGKILYVDTDSIVSSFKKIDGLMDRDWGSDVYFNSSLRDTVIVKACFAGVRTYSLVFLNGVFLTRLNGTSSAVTFEKFSYCFYNNFSLIIPNGCLIKKNYNLKPNGLGVILNLSLYSKRLFTGDKRSTLPLSKGTH